MSAGTLIRVTYWSGWASFVLAFLYKLLINLHLVAGESALRLQLFPRHFWQLGVALFLICIATDVCARRKAA